MNMRRQIFFLLMIVLVGSMLSACSHDIDSNMSKTVTNFSFLTQDEKKLALDDLKGDWWLAYFSYTNCRTVCPRTTANMVNIQKKLKEDDLYPQIISFNVDPENDGAADLKEYAAENDVDLDSWDFLTGYDFETIQNLSNNTFDAVLEEGAADQMSHSYMFYLINPDGEVVKEYDGMGVSALHELIDDVKTVLK